MAIMRFTASADNTITNAYRSSLLDNQRATGSNMGAADVLEVFSIYSQASASSGELSRALVKFPVTEISASRLSGDVPASGSVNFFLRMFNAKHAATTPSSYSMQVVPISQSWEEGTGLDMDEYKDKTKDGVGSNWLRRTGNTSWNLVGGDYDYEPKYTVSFEEGDEDLEVDITELVEEWIAGLSSTVTVDQRTNYGVGVFLDSTFEAYHSSSALTENDGVTTGEPADGVLLHNVTGSQRSYYTKKFFSRSSEFFFKRPIIEARWDSSTKDDRGNFFASSSLADETSNLNTIYLYNIVRGQYKNIPSIGDGEIYVRIYLDESDENSEFLTDIKQKVGTETSTNTKNAFVTGGLVPGETGIYSASFSLDTTSSVVYDRWFAADTSVSDTGAPTSICFHTGAININHLTASGYNDTNPKYVTTIMNMKPSYDRDEVARFRLYTRERNWCPNNYTKFTTDVSSSIIDNAYFKLVRIQDDLDVIDYGTGSLNHTLLSYDNQGNYFDLDMSMLEEGYSYGIKLVYKSDTVYHEQPEIFKFRVE